YYKKLLKKVQVKIFYKLISFLSALLSSMEILQANISYFILKNGFSQTGKYKN
ncbi:hypothetical protein LCGC14_2699400, partial [marine sediment metagenome]